jgi:hypothetical protein
MKHYLEIGIDASIGDAVEIAEDYAPIRLPLTPTEAIVMQEIVSRADQVDSTPGDGEANIARTLKMSMRLFFLKMSTHADLNLYAKVVSE